MNTVSSLLVFIRSTVRSDAVYSFSHRNCFSLSISEQGTHGAKQRSIHVPSLGAPAYHTLLQQRLVPGLLGLSPRCTLSCCDRDPYRRFQNTGNHRKRIHKSAWKENFNLPHKKKPLSHQLRLGVNHFSRRFIRRTSLEVIPKQEQWNSPSKRAMIMAALHADCEAMAIEKSS